MIISNATPLIAFAHIGQLELLRKVVENLIVPQAVAYEISEYTQTKRGVMTKRGQSQYISETLFDQVEGMT